DRELNEGDRHMTRLAKTAQWYLERGEKDKAEAVSAGLMQYGAQRFGKLGSMAAAAYSGYQKDGRPEHLQQMSKNPEKTHEMIPDGAKMDVSLNPETHMLQATRIGADGKEQTYDVKPEELPGLIQKTMDKSAYWQQIFQLSDPGLAKQRESQKYETSKELEKRGYEAGTEAAKNARELQEAKDKEARDAAREQDKEARTAA